MTVVTWQTPSGDTVDLCRECDKLPAQRNERGEEYCQVSHGAHRGTCQDSRHAEVDGFLRGMPDKSIERRELAVMTAHREFAKREVSR
jgi:hypothetical protein